MCLWQNSHFLQNIAVMRSLLAGSKLKCSFYGTNAMGANYVPKVTIYMNLYEPELQFLHFSPPLYSFLNFISC